MEKELYLVSLYDYYKNLLTEKQREYFEDYYFDNLTLTEISENNNVSKNAISKQLLIIKEKLTEYENNLNLLKNKERIKEILKEDFSKIEEYI